MYHVSCTKSKDEISVLPVLDLVVFLFQTMLWLLVILFVIKLYAWNNTFKLIKKKHGQDIIMIVRSYESLKTKLMKVRADIKFIKSCKNENLIPTFSKVNLAIKSDSRKLKLP